MNKNQQTAVGISWYRHETFDQCLALFDDASEMRDTFEEWLSDAQRIEATAKSKGMSVFRIEIDPVKFPEWCQREGIAKLDSHARSLYCSQEVERIVKRRKRNRRK